MKRSAQNVVAKDSTRLALRGLGEQSVNAGAVRIVEDVLWCLNDRLL